MAARELGVDGDEPRNGPGAGAGLAVLLAVSSVGSFTTRSGTVTIGVALTLFVLGVVFNLLYDTFCDAARGGFTRATAAVAVAPAESSATVSSERY